MASESTRTVSVAFTGDVDWTEDFAGPQANSNSPAVTELKTLAAGANTITVPGGGSTPKGVTIVPPSNNTETLTLKGVTGDTGVPLHKTNPTSLGLETGSVSFCLTAGAGGIAGVRLIWD